MSAKRMRQVERGSEADDVTTPFLGSGHHVQAKAGAINIRTKEIKKGSGSIATFFNFAKSSVGSGSFALPWGIMQAGVLVGSFGMALLGIASVYTMQMMLELKRKISEKYPEEKNINYTKIGDIVLGSVGKWSVNIAVLGCNLGVCAGYMIFISTNLQWVFNCISVRADSTTCFNTWEIYAILLPILIILTFLPSFGFLAYAAYVGSLFLVIAMAVVYVYGPQTHIFCAIAGIGTNLRYVPDHWSGLAQWFGVTAFLFCIHSMVIPLESVMKKPQNMPKILDMTALVVVGINVPFAIYGYLLFGENTQGYVFSNLPGNWFNTIVRMFLSIELTLTFPIVIKPATDVMEEILKNILMFFRRKFDIQQISNLYDDRRCGGYCTARTVMTFTLRGLLVMVSWSVAVGIPRFELCLALVGSLTTTVLAFVLPPLFHLRLLWRETDMKRNAFHLFILILGVCITVIATSINIYMAVKGGNNTPTCEDFQGFCKRSFFDDYEHCYYSIN